MRESERLGVACGDLMDHGIGGLDELLRLRHALACRAQRILELPPVVLASLVHEDVPVVRPAPGNVSELKRFEGSRKKGQR